MAGSLVRLSGEECPPTVACGVASHNLAFYRRGGKEERRLGLGYGRRSLIMKLLQD